MGGDIRLQPRRHSRCCITSGSPVSPRHAVVDRRSVVPVDADVPPVVASLLGCAVLTGGGAVLNAGRPQPGQTVAVVGLGGVGMAAVLTALAHDDVHVVGVDPLPDKLERARAHGVHDAYTPEEAADRGLKAAVVIEAVGHPAALETAIALTAPGGRTVTVGLPRPDARISLSPLGFVAEGRSLIGSYLGSSVPARDIPRFVRAVARRKAAGRIAGVVDDHARRDQHRDGRTRRRQGRPAGDRVPVGACRRLSPWWREVHLLPNGAHQIAAAVEHRPARQRERVGAAR